MVTEKELAVMASVTVGIVDAEFVALEVALRAAQLGADIAALDQLISDDLLFTGPDGRLGTKEQDLEAYRSGAIRFLRYEPEELRVRRVGTHVAITSLRAHLTVEVNGEVIGGTYRYTRIWARENVSPWRVVGGHVSSIPS